MEITINDEVYTLDGLIKAYKLQLDALEQSVDDRMILALSSRLADSSTIKRLLCNELQHSRPLQQEIADRLTHENDNFVQHIVNRVEDRIMLLFEDKIQELVKRNLEAWWERRHTEIKNIVDSQIDAGNAAAQRRESTLKGMLQLFLGDAIKDTVVDVVKEEVSGRITELRAEPTLRIDSPAIFVEPLYPAENTETIPYYYAVGLTTFTDLEEAKNFLSPLAPGTQLNFVRNGIVTTIYEATDTFLLQNTRALKLINDTTGNLEPVIGPHEARGFRYEIGSTIFASLDEGKRALRNAYEGTRLYYVDESERTLIYTASGTSEIIPCPNPENPPYPNDH